MSTKANANASDGNPRDAPPQKMNKAMDSGGGGGRPGGSGRKIALLAEYIDCQVSVITNDGRNIIGTMRGFDQVCNVIVEKSVERVFSQDVGVQTIELGMYVIRGDNIAVIGQVDSEKDAKVPWDSIKAPPLKPVVH